ncbi:alternate-type signal peptide domain-containing protein [Naasia sp. SYSU D00948]|uniref:alternate-type signal peptide domain-containing protein n=1 Tax=Naasia sp. SYSU D00948 TaxID=2817379 RepID=UPI001B3160E7|nr:alternate-type signal peptide domain-containing protein [Naasia sp. SYSU D00948]
MNKLVKGSIAGAAGIALLLGGAGTFALWNTSDSLTAPSITAGHLTLTANNNGVWKTLAGDTITPSTYRIIPGTTLVYTQTLSIDAVGDGLKANLTHTGLAAAGPLADYTTETLEVTSSTATVDGSTLKFTSGLSTVNVKLTVVFPSTVTGTQGQGSTLDLSQITFTLAQTP